MNDLSNKILDKIGQEDLKPKAKWRFTAQHGLMWSLFGISVILGSVSFAILLYHLNNVDWDLYSPLEGNSWEMFLESLPYFWILFAVLFIVTSYYYFRHTKKGYKYNMLLTIGGSLVLSILTGSGLYAAHIGEDLDMMASQQIPLYHNLVPNKEDRWTRPERGFLAGEIESLAEQALVLQDFQGNIWEIHTGQAVQPSGFILLKGKLIRVVGQKTSLNVFQARIIRPWVSPLRNALPLMRQHMLEYIQQK